MEQHGPNDEAHAMMKPKEMHMDTLIDRYLAAVSENLPAKQRTDNVT